jgi:hypothetical protein
MGKIKLELNTPIEGALKYAPPGRRYDSTIPGKQGSVMYSLQSGECFFLDEDVCDEPDRMFKDAGIGAGDPFRLTVRKRNGQRYYELKKLSDAAEPALDPRRYPDENGAFDGLPTSLPSSKLEQDLQASVDQAKAQRATPSKNGPAAPVSRTVNTNATTAGQHSNAIAVPRGQTVSSSLMGAALISAIDACQIGAAYGRSKGLDIQFCEGDYRAIAATIYIQACKDPVFVERTTAAGARQWQQ